ncbi:MAG: SGNH/GDSL hydrolase family protein, partial [Pseudomonadota bacterium]
LGFFLLRERKELALARGEVAALNDAREQLLLESASDRAPFPHTVPSLSYVLNPALKKATYMAGADSTYPVNRLGLRGGPVPPKSAGTKRIVLVGDSLFFGWKLADEDRLEVVLTDLLERHLPEASRQLEIVTAAIPGWNTRDQDSFLRYHLGRLSPDYIVWSLIRNDLFDTPGVVPPGVLASWDSPQAKVPVPYQLRSPERHLDLPLPSLLLRWQRNLKRIERFADDYGIATTVLWWRDKQRAVLDDLLQDTGFGGPVLYIPGRYRYDEVNWCVAPPDCHPTRWANDRIAVALAQHLVDVGLLPSIAWSAEERAIVESFAAARERRTDPDQRRRFYEAAARQVPERFGPRERHEAAVLYGMSGEMMEQNGAFVLRAPDLGPRQLQLDLQASLPNRGKAQGVTITVPSNNGEVVTARLTLNDREPHRLLMTLPSAARFGLHEIQWRFDYAECQGPTQCPAARFLGAALVDLPAG